MNVLGYMLTRKVTGVECTRRSDRAVKRKREESEKAGYLLRRVPAALSYAIDLDLDGQPRGFAIRGGATIGLVPRCWERRCRNSRSVNDRMLLVDAKSRGQIFAIGFTFSAGLGLPK